MAFKIPDTPEELFKQGGQQIGNFNKWVPSILVVVIILFAVLQSFYKIETGHAGVIRRFGAFYTIQNPGLHFKLPWVDELDIVNVKFQYKEEFGFRTVKAGIKTEFSKRNFSDESLMLTGDTNVLDVNWTVEFKIKDPRQLLFNVRNPQGTVRDVSEVVMRQIIGDSSVSESLTIRRNVIGQEAHKKIQEILDHYEVGIQINAVNLQDVSPPFPVRDSFNQVNEAKQQKEKAINRAMEEKNKVIPKALGQAEQMISEAEGYALERVMEAEGDAKKFSLVWNAYKSSEDVTRKRMYLETVTEVLQNVGQVYLFEPDTNGVLPLMNLGKKEGVVHE